VVDENNCYLGIIQEILQTGANDVYVIKSKGVKDLLLPAISSVITSVDLPSGNMIVTVPQGL
jgi:16S rRNA processing protein RimM